MQTEINNCLNVLKKGGIILYPNDTVWGIGCDEPIMKQSKEYFS